MSWKNNSRNIKKDFNHRNKKKFDKNKPKNKFTGISIEVYNGDVNGAIRKLKKVLERMEFQKELSKREFYEKPSAQRKRKKDQAIKKANKERDNMIMRGEWMPQERVGSKHLKGKREKRKAWMIKEKVKVLRRRGRAGK